MAPWNEAPLPPDLHVAAFRALHSVTSRIHHSLDLNTTLDAIAQGVVDAAGFEVAATNLVRDDGCSEVVSVAGDQDARRSLLHSVHTAEFWDRLMKASIPLGRLRFIDGRTHPDVTEGYDGVWTSTRTHAEGLNTWHPMDLLFAPLRGSAGRWLGVLSVDLPVHGLRPGPEQCEILELFADHASLSIEHAQLHEDIRRKEAQARDAAMHDPLTGLWNHARLIDDLSRGPVAEPTAVLVVDLDDFKAVNDRFGHLVGDRVLRCTAERILEVTLDDVVIRMGGDEFVIVLKGSDSGDRMHGLAADIARAVALPIDIDGRVCAIRASVGTAHSPGGITLESLLAQSDADMYRCKRS